MTEQTEFKIGDIITHTKGEPGKPGHKSYTYQITQKLGFADLGAGFISIEEVRCRIEHGAEIELVERPVPPLPTKPNTLGWATHRGEHCLVKRGMHGWWVYNEAGYPVVGDVEELSDFTEAVLIPKELADEITTWADGGAVDGDRLLGDIAEHLKGDNR